MTHAFFGQARHTRSIKGQKLFLSRDGAQQLGK